MKKTIIVVFCVILCLSILTGCGNDNKFIGEWVYSQEEIANSEPDELFDKSEISVKITNDKYEYLNNGEVLSSDDYEIIDGELYYVFYNAENEGDFRHWWSVYPNVTEIPEYKIGEANKVPSGITVSEDGNTLLMFDYPWLIRK